MKNTIVLLMFMALASGLFSACATEVAPEEAMEEEVDQEQQAEVEDEQPPVLDIEVGVEEEVDDVKVSVKYVDGNYTYTPGYQTPAGQDSVKVSFVVENDVVQSVEVQALSENETSQRYQGLFSAGIASEVQGKKIDELGELSQVNGSSLTPNAFNKAVASLKAEAAK